MPQPKGRTRLGSGPNSTAQYRVGPAAGRPERVLRNPVHIRALQRQSARLQLVAVTGSLVFVDQRAIGGGTLSLQRRDRHRAAVGKNQGLTIQALSPAMGVIATLII